MNVTEYEVMNMTENEDVIYADETDFSQPASDIEARPDWATSVTLWFPRIIGSIYLISALLMFRRAWGKKEHMFHRIILVMAVHLFTVGVFFVYGRAAFPKETLADLGVEGNGSITTCDTQGFFLQFCFFSALSYYA